MGCSGSKPRPYPVQMVPQYSGAYVQEAPMYVQPPQVVQQSPLMAGSGHVASEAFMADWSRFLHLQTPVIFEQTVRVDGNVFPAHEVGRDWAEQTLVRIHQDLEGMGIGGDYNYDQNGDDRAGEILIECKTNNHGGADQSRTIKWKLLYEVCAQQSPRVMTQPVLQPQYVY